MHCVHILAADAYNSKYFALVGMWIVTQTKVLSIIFVRKLEVWLTSFIDTNFISFGNIEGIEVSI